MLKRLAVALAFLTSAATTQAADIRIKSDGWVYVTGPFVSADGAQFKEVADRVQTSTTVVFESDGGSASAAILIGSEIKRRGWATAIMSGKTCVSACGFAWLAGHPRLMDRDARVGFHGVYVIENGKPVVSGSANALMGTYLASLGLTAPAIFFVTDAKPEGMNWLTQQKAAELGFNVFVLDPPPRAAKGRKALLEDLFRRSSADEGAD
jgi:hypothetical protein